MGDTEETRFDKMEELVVVKKVIGITMEIHRPCTVQKKGSKNGH
jgi:hypothetical protein